jgi:hypothetical protein
VAAAAAAAAVAAVAGAHDARSLSILESRDSSAGLYPVCWETGGVRDCAGELGDDCATFVAPSLAVTVCGDSTSGGGDDDGGDGGDDGDGDGEGVASETKFCDGGRGALFLDTRNCLLSCARSRCRRSMTS